MSSVSYEMLSAIYCCCDVKSNFLIAALKELVLNRKLVLTKMEHCLTPKALLKELVNLR
jgi:hypothetical protein